MTAATIHLNLIPDVEHVTKFMDDIVPQLTAAGLDVEYDPLDTSNTCDSIVARIRICDLQDLVYDLNGTITYTVMADIAGVLERKQFELQLNALLPRMAAVGWYVKNRTESNAFLGAANKTDPTLTLVRDGQEEEIPLTYGTIRALREQLIRTEAIRLVQSHWLELEALGFTIQITDGLIIADRGTQRRSYGLTADEVKELIAEIHPAPPLASNVIV